MYLLVQTDKYAVGLQEEWCDEGAAATRHNTGMPSVVSVIRQKLN